MTKLIYKFFTALNLFLGQLIICLTLAFAVGCAIDEMLRYFHNAIDDTIGFWVYRWNRKEFRKWYYDKYRPSDFLDEKRPR